MSLFRRSRPQSAPVEKRSAFSLQQLGMLFGAVEGSLGVSSIDEALRDAATWACVKVKAQGLASMPVDVVRINGASRQSMPAPQLVTSPSLAVSRRVWTYQVGVSLFTDANVFGIILDVDTAGKPSRIELVNPAQCKERRVVDNVPQVKINGVVHRRYPVGDLWHVPGEMVEPGSPWGLSPVWYGSKSTATSLAAEAFGGKFFTEGAHPTAVFTSDLDTDETMAKQIKDRIIASTRGSREPLVVSSGKFAQLQVNPSDSQFLELMNFEVVQTCRRHGVPPSMVYATVAGQNVTYANVTQADLQFLKHTLSYPIDLLEEALSALLPAPRVVKYNRDAILRADAKARHEVHKMRLEAKTTTVNEVRALEDEVPFADPKFDEPGIPGGGTPAPPEDDTAPAPIGDAA